MNKLYSLVALAVLVAASTPTSVADQHPPIFLKGDFLIGEPIGFNLRDACIDERLEERNSNCRELERAADGGDVDLIVTSALNEGEVKICWYSADKKFLGCNGAIVLDGAKFMSVAGLGGIKVDWEVVITGGGD